MWRARPSRTIDVAVLDKTVPFRTWIEHRSLFWILNHLKIVKTDGARYDATRDYYGAHPPVQAGREPERTADLPAEAAARADLVYLADTYGVYRGDLKSGPRMEAALERSPKIYGGLTHGTNPELDKPTEGGIVAGLGTGLWHGFISPATLIISFFNPAIQMYVVHNTGSLYNLGFLFGVAIVFLVLRFLGGRRR